MMKFEDGLQTVEGLRSYIAVISHEIWLLRKKLERADWKREVVVRVIRTDGKYFKKWKKLQYKLKIQQEKDGLYPIDYLAHHYKQKYNYLPDKYVLTELQDQLSDKYCEYSSENYDWMIEVFDERVIQLRKKYKKNGI